MARSDPPATIAPAVVHPRERRIVAALADPRLGRPERRGGEPLDGLDVAPRHGTTASSSSGAGSGASPGSAPTAREQVDARPEPARRQRVARPEVVGGGARAVHEQHACHDTGDGTRLHHAPARQARHPPGMRVALIDIDDETIRPLLADRTADVTEGWPEPDTDVVLLGADSIAQLAPCRDLATRIRPNGAIWVVSRKGKAATLRDIEVIDAAKAARLVDNKVASFSATHTALRLVIPVALRPR